MDQWAHLNLLSRICIWKVGIFRSPSNSHYFRLCLTWSSAFEFLHPQERWSLWWKCHKDVQRFSLSHCSFQIPIPSSTVEIGMKKLILTPGPAGSCGWEVTKGTSSVSPSPRSHKKVMAPEYVPTTDFSGIIGCLLWHQASDPLVLCHRCGVCGEGLWEVTAAPMQLGCTFPKAVLQQEENSRDGGI